MGAIVKAGSCRLLCVARFLYELRCCGVVGIAIGVIWRLGFRETYSFSTVWKR